METKNDIKNELSKSEKIITQVVQIKQWKKSYRKVLGK